MVFRQHAGEVVDAADVVEDGFEIKIQVFEDTRM